MNAVSDVQSRPRRALVAALVAAQKAAQPVAKDGKNKFHNYSYATGEDLIAEAKAALNAHGLAFWTESWKLNKEESTLTARYILAHDSGEFEEFETTTPCIEEKGRPLDKAAFGCLTESLAYLLRGILLLRREDETAVKPSARDDRNHTPRSIAPVEAAAPKESDDERAKRVAQKINAAKTEADIAAAGKEARGLPKLFTDLLAAKATKRRAELSAPPPEAA